MRINGRTGIIAAISFALLASSTPIDHHAQAASFKFKKTKIGKFFKNSPKIIRKITKDPVFRNVVVPLALGAVLQRNGVHGAFAVGVAFAVAGAPKAFQRDMAHTYGDDLRWSGCVKCRKRRVVVVPGRTVSSAEELALKQQVEDDTKELQTALKALNFYKKRIDGDYGPGTRRAVSAFQNSIGADKTSTLSAEQRVLLFGHAVNAGFEPTLDLQTIDNTALAQKDLDIEPIPEYKLAKSQFDRFTQDYLMDGDLGAVKSAEMRPDGAMKITVDTGSSSSGKESVFIADAENLYATAHEISDQWAQLILHDRDSGATVTLNTVDRFDSAGEAQAWIEKAHNKIAILAKLTGRTVRKSGDTIVANSPEAARGFEEASAPEEVASAPEAARGFEEASAPETSSIELSSNPTVNPEEVFIDELSTGATEDGGNICRENVYVSFNFPDGEEPISHYNITPPENILMMDNGDSTAYFTGSCVKGSYDYKYVYVKHEKEKKTWEHIVREGTFELASNANQCEISLQGTGSNASVACF